MVDTLGLGPPSIIMDVRVRLSGRYKKIKKIEVYMICNETEKNSKRAYSRWV